MKTGIATAPIASRPHCVIYLSYVDLGEERCGDILNCQQKKLMKKIGNCIVTNRLFFTTPKRMQSPLRDSTDVISANT